MLSCGAETARRHGEVKNGLRQKGYPIPRNDIWTAAIAPRNDLTLIARNVQILLENSPPWRILSLPEGFDPPDVRSSKRVCGSSAPWLDNLRFFQQYRIINQRLNLAPFVALCYNGADITRPFL